LGHGKVYTFYRHWQDWDDKTIYQNVLLRYSARDTVFSSFDPDSIMQYPVPGFLTEGDFAIGWNDNLSAGDKEFIACIYPP
jgi:hypothetical protein